MSLARAVPRRVSPLSSVVFAVASVAVFRAMSLTIVYFGALNLGIELAGSIPIARDRSDGGVDDGVTAIAEDFEVVLPAENLGESPLNDCVSRRNQRIALSTFNLHIQYREVHRARTQRDRAFVIQVSSIGSIKAAVNSLKAGSQLVLSNSALNFSGLGVHESLPQKQPRLRWLPEPSRK
jgi:hypothetical protein